MRKYSFFKSKGARLHSKLGEMWWTGQTAGSRSTGGTCEGATAECIKYCYAKRGNFLFPSVTEAYRKMTFGVLNELTQVFADFRLQLDNAKKPPLIIRFNESGDFVSMLHFIEVVCLAVDYPQIQMYAYTKATRYLDEYYTRFGDQLPSNLHILVSNAEALAKYTDKRNVNAFVVDQRGSEAPSGVLRCPGYNTKGRRTGMRCSECGLCFCTSGKEIHVNEH